jgi:UDP-N-acetylmuramoylalanine--D-glutamate ligase
MNMLVNEIEKHCKSAVLLKGTGINKLQIAHIGIKTNITASLKEAVGEAMNAASEGDIVLFSPAFASFGMFKNEYDRNDQFMEIVNNL